MKCVKMHCSLPHNPYCCSLPSPVCLLRLLICTCINSSPIACPQSSVLCWCLLCFFILFWLYLSGFFFSWFCVHLISVLFIMLKQNQNFTCVDVFRKILPPPFVTDRVPTWGSAARGRVKKWGPPPALPPPGGGKDHLLFLIFTKSAAPGHCPPLSGPWLQSTVGSVCCVFLEGCRFIIPFLNISWNFLGRVFSMSDCSPKTK